MISHCINIIHILGFNRFIWEHCWIDAVSMYLIAAMYGHWRWWTGLMLLKRNGNWLYFCTWFMCWWWCCIRCILQGIWSSQWLEEGAADLSTFGRFRDTAELVEISGDGIERKDQRSARTSGFEGNDRWSQSADPSSSGSGFATDFDCFTTAHWTWNRIEYIDNMNRYDYRRATASSIDLKLPIRRQQREYSESMATINWAGIRGSNDSGGGCCKDFRTTYNVLER